MLTYIVTWPLTSAVFCAVWYLFMCMDICWHQMSSSIVSHQNFFGISSLTETGAHLYLASQGAPGIHSFHPLRSKVICIPLHLGLLGGRELLGIQTQVLMHHGRHLPEEPLPDPSGSLLPEFVLTGSHRFCCIIWGCFLSISLRGLGGVTAASEC